RSCVVYSSFFFFQAEDGIRDFHVTGVQTCALPIFFAGGLFFLAGPTYVVCTEDVKIGLPEVKRGLFPFQVMASLLDVMPKRKVRSEERRVGKECRSRRTRNRY